jgi:exopolysaccharide production protein ExoQ
MTTARSISGPPHDKVYWLVALIVSFVLINSLVAIADPLALAVTLALPAIPFVLFATLRGMTGDRTYGALLAIIIVFVLAANFRNRAYSDKDIDFQVALKLCAIGALFVPSMLFIRKIFDGIHAYGMLSWLSFFIYTVVTCSYTVEPLPALVSTMSLLGAFLFVCYLGVQFDRKAAIGIIVTAGACLWVGSLAVYFADPSLGRMSDWVGGDFVETWRLQGLFGSSNGAGMSAASGLFLVVAFYAREPGYSRALAAIATLSGLACLVLSNNRMAMFALAVSTTTLFALNRSVARRSLLLLTIALFGSGFVFLFANRLLAMISRSGSWDEVMSATGRTRIWPVVIELWSQTPFLGRGFGAALYILPMHPDLFRAAAHAHNLYLEQLFSGGLIGLGLFTCSIIMTIAVAWRTKAAREFSFLAFFLVYGLTEPVISGPVSFPLILMFLAVVLILRNARPRSLRAVPDEHATSERAGVDGYQLPDPLRS